MSSAASCHSLVTNCQKSLSTEFVVAVVAEVEAKNSNFCNSTRDKHIL